MAATDTKILESRLITRDSAIGGSSVSRCASRMQQFFKTLSESKEEKDIAAAYECYCRDIVYYQLEMEKYAHSFDMCAREIEEYDALENDIESKITETQSAIEVLSEELMQQKKLRRHREECENLARVVNSVPSRSKTNRDINAVEEEIARLKDQIASKETQESVRVKQFKLLMQAIADLSKSIDEDELTQSQLTLFQNQQQEMDGLGDDDEGEEDEDRDEEGSGDKRSARGESQRPAAKKPRVEYEEEEEDAGSQQPSDTEATGGVKTSGSRSSSPAVSLGEGLESVPTPNSRPPLPPVPPPRTQQQVPPPRPPSIAMPPRPTPPPITSPIIRQQQMRDSAEPEEGEEAEDGAMDIGK